MSKKPKSKGRAPSERERQKRLTALRLKMELLREKHAKAMEPLLNEYHALDGYVCRNCGALGSCPC